MADYEPDCLFCRIAAGEIPADVVYSDDDGGGLPRHQPAGADPRAGHPAPAYPVRGRPDRCRWRLLAALFAALRRVAEEAGLRGYRIVTNVGAEAGQSVFHLHLHLLGGRAMTWPPG